MKAIQGVYKGMRKRYRDWFGSDDPKNQPSRKKRRRNPVVPNGKSVKEKKKKKEKAIPPPPPHFTPIDQGKAQQSNPRVPKGSYFVSNKKPLAFKRKIHNARKTEISREVIDNLTNLEEDLKVKFYGGERNILEENFKKHSGNGRILVQEKAVMIEDTSRDKKNTYYEYRNNYYEEDFAKASFTFEYDVQISKISDNQTFLMRFEFPGRNTIINCSMDSFYKKWVFEMLKKKPKVAVLAVEEEEDLNDDREEEEKREEESPPISKESNDQEKETKTPQKKSKKKKTKIKKKKKKKKKKRKKVKKTKDIQLEVEENIVTEVLEKEEIKDDLLKSRKSFKIKMVLNGDYVSIFCNEKSIKKLPNFDIKDRNWEDLEKSVKIFFGVKRSVVKLSNFVISPSQY